ncbi:hypothetical protein [Streptomyces sp. NPDC002343]
MIGSAVDRWPRRWKATLLAAFGSTAFAASSRSSTATTAVKPGAGYRIDHANGVATGSQPEGT